MAKYCGFRQPVTKIPRNCSQGSELVRCLTSLGPVCGQFREGARLCVRVVKNLSRSPGELFKSLKGNCLKVSKNSPLRKGGGPFQSPTTDPDPVRMQFFPSSTRRLPPHAPSRVSLDSRRNRSDPVCSHAPLSDPISAEKLRGNLRQDPRTTTGIRSPGNG